jgi:hypothetical protein
MFPMFPMARIPRKMSQFPESSKVAIMPGSKPGERRGGRQKGTPNKATTARKADLHQALALVFAKFGPEFIDTLTPARLQLIAMREAAKAGFVASALAIARDVAPYYDAKLASLIVEPPQEAEEDKARRLHEAMRQMRETVGDVPPIRVDGQ